MASYCCLVWSWSSSPESHAFAEKIIEYSDVRHWSGRWVVFVCMRGFARKVSDHSVCRASGVCASWRMYTYAGVIHILYVNTNAYVHIYYMFMLVLENLHTEIRMHICTYAHITCVDSHLFMAHLVPQGCNDPKSLPWWRRHTESADRPRGGTWHLQRFPRPWLRSRSTSRFKSLAKFQSRSFSHLAMGSSWAQWIDPSGPMLGAAAAKAPE